MINNNKLKPRYYYCDSCYTLYRNDTYEYNQCSLCDFDDELIEIDERIVNVIFDLQNKGYEIECVDFGSMLIKFAGFCSFERLPSGFSITHNYCDDEHNDYNDVDYNGVLTGYTSLYYSGEYMDKNLGNHLTKVANNLNKWVYSVNKLFFPSEGKVRH